MALIKSQDAQSLMRNAVAIELGRSECHAHPTVGADSHGSNEPHPPERGHGIPAADVERIREEARKAGWEEGHAEAIKQHGGALEKLQEAWVRAAQRWDADRQRMEVEARQSLIALALNVAEKIVHRVPKIDPSVVAEQVAEAVAMVVHAHDARVCIHPDDRAIVERAMPEIVRQMRGGRHVTLVEDPSIERGGCVVTAGEGSIDATLGRQVARIVELLLPMREAGPALKVAAA